MGVKITSFKKRYLPFEDEIVKSEIIWKPVRYFYSNRKNIKKLKYYNQMVKEYFPYSYELFQNNEVTFGVICPKEYQGETEDFMRKMESKIKEDFHISKIRFILKLIENRQLAAYKKAVYDNNDFDNCNLIYVVVTQNQKDKLIPKESPYFVIKAKFIGLGIPTQDIKIETIRKNLNQFTLTNIALNTYAKIGGTAWTIEREEKLRDELIIGIGSTISNDNNYVLGIAQIFHNDGRYIAGDVSPLSTFENYSKNLEQHLFKILEPNINNIDKSETFRLIFHLFKSASEKYEIEAIKNLQERFKDKNFEFALVHLGYGHNFRLYYNEGKYNVIKGTYIQLSDNTAILHFVDKSDLPLKIEIDKRSSFTSLFYIAKQIYWFSHLSHRSYNPAKKTVSIMYPSLMAKMIDSLKQVDSWDYEKLEYIKGKLWFI